MALGSTLKVIKKMNCIFDFLIVLLFKGYLTDISFMIIFDLGATNPEYIVTADDVDKLIAVECIPMDDQGHQVIL